MADSTASPRYSLQRLFAGTTMLVTALLPFGSFAHDQPPVEVEFDIHVSSAADIGKSLYVRARGGFEFGTDSLGASGSIAGPNQDPAINKMSTGWNAGDLIPQLFKIKKTNSPEENETATGSNFPITWQITVDIAAGQTLTDFKVTDELPTDLRYLGNVSITTATGTPGSVTQQPQFDTQLNASNNALIVDFASVPALQGLPQGSPGDDQEVVSATAFESEFFDHLFPASNATLDQGSIQVVPAGVVLSNDSSGNNIELDFAPLAAGATVTVTYDVDLVWAGADV